MMGKPNKKEIIQKMEQMTNGARLSLKLGEVFGAGYVSIELNQSYPGKGQKKYLMRWGKSAEEVKTLAPFMNTDKAKNIAGWVADRSGDWI